jgi:GNAT superfamily N-acetyltransferase
VAYNAPPSDHPHEISDVIGLQDALDNAGGVGGPVDWTDVQNKPATFPPEVHDHDLAYEPKNANIQQHVAAAHAPSNAQKNSDITKAEIEAKLTGEIGTHTHAGGGNDPWTILALDADFTTSSATAVDVGLGFTPSANGRYMFEAVIGIRTATATVNPRVGFAWATGMTDGIAQIDESQSATARLMANGNIAAPLLVAVGGIPNTTQTWPVTIWGWVKAGGTPAGSVRIQLATETAGTVVRVTANSYLRYRTYWLIRLAKEKDLPSLVKMARRFFEASGYSDITSFDRDSFRATFSNLIFNHAAVVLVAEKDEQAVGMAAALIYPFYFNANHRTSQEMLWWVDPEHRGIGSELFEALEREVKVRGAESLTMVTLEALTPERIGKFYQSRGYRPSDHSYIKKLS